MYSFQSIMQEADKINDFSPPLSTHFISESSKQLSSLEHVRKIALNSLNSRCFFSIYIVKKEEKTRNFVEKSKKTKNREIKRNNFVR